MQDATHRREAAAEHSRHEAGIPVPATRATMVIAVAGTVALGTWGLIRLMGVEMVADRGGAMTPVMAVDVAVAAGLFGLLAWLVQAGLRRSGRAAWWPFVGSTALSVSMTGPSYQADGASAMALMTLHLVVGAVLIAGFHLAGTQRHQAG